MTVLDLFLKHNIIQSTNDVKNPEKLHSKIGKQWDKGLKEDCQEFVDVSLLISA